MTINYLAFVLFTLLLLAFVGYGTYRTAQLLPNWPPHLNPLLQPAETTLRFVMLAICISLGFLSGLSWVTLGWQLPEPISQTSWGIVWGLAIAAVYIITTRWVMQKSGGRYYTPVVVRVIIPRSRRQFLAIALAMVSIVILEELLFRSLFLGGFSPLAPPWLLLAAGAVVFGLMHSPQGWWGVIAIALGGLLLGLMFLAKQSLLMPVVAHYVANMAQIGYAYHFGIPTMEEAQSDPTP